MKFPFQKYWEVQKTYLRPHLKKIGLLTVLLFLSIALQLVNPQIIRYYIDTFQLLEDGFLSISLTNKRLIEAAALYVIIALLQQSIHVTSIYISQNLAWKSTNKMRVDFTQHCINLDMTFHNEHSPGEMIERIDGDITNLSEFFSQFTILVLANFLLITGVLLTLFLEDWRLGVVFSIFTILTVFILYLIWNLSVPHRREAREISADLLGVIEEHLAGREDICALGASQYTMKRFFQYSKKEYQTENKAILVSRLIHITIMGMITLGSTLVFVTSVPLFNEGAISVGTIFMINSYVTLLFNPIMQLVRQTQNLSLADASIDRVNSVFTINKKVQDVKAIPKSERDIVKALSQSNSALSLEFDRVTFAYENETILKNLSFNLNPKQVIGLIGRTGSGKTTISRLIFRLYDPSSGNIRINGIDTKRIPLRELRQKMAYVTQKVELFQASLRNNITLFDNTIPDEKIIECIKEVGLDEWFNRLPDGLNTKLGDRGFSAGQAQLLAITRVFLHKPSLVILDEASSRLDPVTERLIEKALDRLLQNRTVLIIAHRLKTLDRVDTIIHIEKGKIIEFGGRNQLLEDPNSLFFQLLKKGQIMEVLV